MHASSIVVHAPLQVALLLLMHIDSLLGQKLQLPLSLCLLLWFKFPLRGFITQALLVLFEYALLFLFEVLLSASRGLLSLLEVGIIA